MQLRLELMTGPGAGEMRLVGGTGAAFVIGTSPGVTWLLPLTADAPGDLRIERAQGGLSVRLQAGAALLDQRALTENTPRPLLAGAVLEVGGHQLRVLGAAQAGHTGHQDHSGHMGDSAGMQPTISSILAGGAAALESDPRAPAPTDADWISTLTSAPAPRAEWQHLGRYAGGNEPGTDSVPKPPVAGAPGAAAPLPATPFGEDGQRTFLPEDWAASPSEMEQRLTQAPAAEATLRIGMSEPPRAGLQGPSSHAGAAARRLAAPDAAEARQAGTAPDPAASAFLRGAGLVPEELPGPMAAQMEAFGQMLRAALSALVRLEACQHQRAAELEINGSAAPIAPRQVDATLLAVAHAPDLALQSLAARLEDLERETQAMWTGMQAFAAQARAALDPDSIEAASAASGGMGARFNRPGAAWAAYRARHAAGPLSQAALAEAWHAAKAGPRPEATAPTVQRPIASGAALARQAVTEEERPR